MSLQDFSVANAKVQSGTGSPRQKEPEARQATHPTSVPGVDKKTSIIRIHVCSHPKTPAAHVLHAGGNYRNRYCVGCLSCRTLPTPISGHALIADRLLPRTQFVFHKSQIWNRQMWCPNCQADVAAEVSAESQRVLCATCSTEIQSGTPVRTGAKTEAARELLRRWANDDLFDPFGPLPGVATKSAEASPETSAAPMVKGPHVDQPELEANPDPAGSRPIYRFETAHSEQNAPLAAKVANTDSESRAEESGPNPVASVVRHVHGPHVSAAQAPHITAIPDAASEDVRAAVQEDHARSSNWSSFWGQILAYIGVGGLTVGTSMVLWGYYGGPADYAPTGWLVVTVGQMLLFLGVVTLVSGGLEQTTEEVAQRIDRLGARLIRIEHATAMQNVRPPHTPVQEFADKPSPSRESKNRETHTM